MPKILIVGAGPAGIAAALELNRRNIPFDIVERKSIGGSARNANLIRNLPGYPESISGAEFSHRAAEQFKNLGIDVVYETVNSIENYENRFKIIRNGIEIFYDAIIVAAGTSPIRAGFDGESELFEKKKLFYEITKLPKVENATVIGGGDVAFDYAITLFEMGIIPKILCRSQPRPIDFLMKSTNSNRIEIIADTRIEKVRMNENERLDIVLDNGSIAETDVIVVAVGRQANTKLLGNFDKFNIFPDGRTNIAGIFLAGDILHPSMRQVSLAIGDGCRVSIFATEYLANFIKR
ncbi:NAD(P)/FAD-dependent oxidoreductase [bacterium]|nr:NAD(P)/FAD-dependent oxidoreductase [bacterium]